MRLLLCKAGFENQERVPLSINFSGDTVFDGKRVDKLLFVSTLRALGLGAMLALKASHRQFDFLVVHYIGVHSNVL